MIVGINTPKRVNLVVFDAAGVAHPRAGVLIAHDGGPVPVEGGYAEWMPYQLGQVAKVGANETASRSAAGLVSMSRPLCHSDGSLDFSDALMLLKEGKGMARARWNGNGLWASCPALASIRISRHPSLSFAIPMKCMAAARACPGRRARQTCWLMIGLWCSKPVQNRRCAVESAWPLQDFSESGCRWNCIGQCRD